MLVGPNFYSLLLSPIYGYFPTPTASRREPLAKPRGRLAQSFPSPSLDSAPPTTPCSDPKGSVEFALSWPRRSMTEDVGVALPYIELMT
jgi:hypothetical protein